MVKKLVYLICFILYSCLSFSQEFNCKVTINSDQIEGTYKQVFSTLEQALNEFINTNKWSDTNFSNIEKIDCNMQFTIKSVPSQDRYAAELMVQARRPVFNTVYTSPTLNFRDTEIEFSYIENEPIVYNENTIESNLVAITTYYLYMILGIDFDSFSYLGGDPFYKRAENIVTLCQSTQEKGWKAFDNTKNRHALVTGLLEEKMKPIRLLWYEYHRKGLDDMAQNSEKGKSMITQTLNNLQEVFDANPLSVLLSLFIDTKRDELVQVYSKSSKQEKEQVYNLLTGIYPAYSKQLESIKELTTN